MSRTRRGTCDGCGKVRKLTYPEKQDIQYYGLCSECFPQVETQADIQRLRQAQEPKQRGPRFAYPCIGGPLDGDYATQADFSRRIVRHLGDRKYEYDEGMFYHLRNEYFAYNAAGGGTSHRLGGRPGMVFIHHAELRPLIAPRDR